MIDSQVNIAPSKAKELGVSAGDVVVMIGRRRKASYARVAIANKKTPKSRCQIPVNMAKNLRLRNDDKVKLVVLEKVKDADEAEEDKDSRSGDLLLLTNEEVPKVSSLTFSPIEDSLRNLESGEGGDELSEDEIRDRFVDPYVQNKDGALVKKGNLLILQDENGKQLEFMVSEVSLEGDEENKDAGELCDVSHSKISNASNRLICRGGGGRRRSDFWFSNGGHNSRLGWCYASH